MFTTVHKFTITGGDVICIDATTRTVTASRSIAFNLGANLAYDASADRVFVPTFQGGIRPPPHRVEAELPATHSSLSARHSRL